MAPRERDRPAHACRPARAGGERGHRRASVTASARPPVVDPGPGGARGRRRGVRAGHGPEDAVRARQLDRRQAPLRRRCATPTCPTSTPGAGSPPATCRTPTTAGGRYPAMEYPVVIGYFAYAAALGHPGPRRSPDLGRAARTPARPRSTASPASPRSRAVLQGHRDPAGAVRAARRLVPRGRAPATALGRDGLRGLTGAGADRADQLGPARGRRGGRRAVGLVARPAGAHRGADRARHRHQALPAVPARRPARGLPAAGPAAARSPPRPVPPR